MAADPKKAAAKKTAAKKSTTKKAATKKAATKKAAARKKAAPLKPAAAEPAMQATIAAEPVQPTPQPQSQGPIPASLEHMQANLFGASLGLAGFAVAWREASVAFGAGSVISQILVGITFGVFAMLVALYVLKFRRHPQAVKAEFHHPIQGNFFAAATMTLMILASSLIRPAPALAETLWAIGAVTNLAVTVAIVTAWISRDWKVTHAAPVWFIPVVGNLIIPIVGTPLGYSEIGWMMFAVGLLFWVVLFTIIFYRLIFDAPMQGPLRPTIFILITPPSLCFIAHTVLSGGLVNGISQMFLGIAIFTFLALIPQVPALVRLPFSLSWWSYVFPLAAFSTACTLYADALGTASSKTLAIGAIALVTVVTLIVTVHTVRYIMAGKVFRPVEMPLPKP